MFNEGGGNGNGANYLGHYEAVLSAGEYRSTGPLTHVSLLLENVMRRPHHPTTDSNQHPDRPDLERSTGRGE